MASKTIIIGEFTFLPGLSFSAGVRILNFAAYVSVAASMEGIEIFGAMSRVKLGPLEIDRPDNVVIPESVSKLGPAVQSLPKEIGSVDEIKKVASVMSLVEQESDGAFFLLFIVFSLPFSFSLFLTKASTFNP